MQFSYFEMEKNLDIASEQTATEATSGRNFIKQPHCRYEMAHF